MGWSMRRRISSYFLVGVSTLMLAACTKTNHNPQDPLESLNRGVYGFNKTIDSAIIKPVAYIYWRYMPSPFQSGIGNFYDNLKEIPNVANDILQGRFAYAASDTSRFLINSTIGIFGFFDIAGSLGLEHRKNDFGQTLYRWGYKDSAYLVIPFLGPSTFRDGIGFAVDYTVFSVWPWVDSDWRSILLGIDVIDTRSRFLRSEVVVDAVSIDEYTFIRSAYLQRRQYLFGQKEEANDDTDMYDDADFGLDDNASDSTDTAADLTPNTTADPTQTKAPAANKAENKAENKTEKKTEKKAQAQKFPEAILPLDR